MKKKHVVKFTKKEGLSPASVAGMIMLRLPLPVTLREGKTLNVDLGLSCNVPLMMFTSPMAKNNGVKLVNDCAIVMPDEKLSVDLMTNLSRASLQDRDAVVVVMPLLSDYELEVE